MKDLRYYINLVEANLADEFIAQAAFRDPGTDTIYPSGAFHDMSTIPEDLDLDTLISGFLTNKGRFLTKEEAIKFFNLKQEKSFDEL
jgi:hypothetical protein